VKALQGASLKVRVAVKRLPGAPCAGLRVRSAEVAEARAPIGSVAASTATTGSNVRGRIGELTLPWLST
jgi:hypothetical protein